MDLKVPEVNEVTLCGRLTRDPELRYMESGIAMCTFSIAVSRRYKTKGGESKEETIFVNTICWRETAEFIGSKLKKGFPVLVSGSLKMNEWDDKATGQKRSNLEVLARRVQMLSWLPKAGEPSGEGHQEHSSGGGQQHGGQQPYESAPKPRPIEEPVPNDEIPF